MFVESNFDDNDDDDDDVASHPQRQSREKGIAARAESAVRPTVTMFFHKPGDEGFCAVAGAGDDAMAVLDARTISGDSWVSDKCRCLRCECLRVMQEVDSVQQRQQRSKPSTRSTPVVLLFLDLDNFGFNQFKSIPPGFSAAAQQGSDDSSENVNPLEHLFVWAFFGSCFTRYHKAWPTADTVCESLPTAARQPGSQSPKVAKKKTIWQQLVEKNCVHFTPCAGQSQAADSVMMAALDLFADRDVILLTGDTKLIDEIHRIRRKRGQKSRRDNEKDMMSDRLTLIDVNDNDRRFVPVWRHLEQQIAQIVMEGRGAVSKDRIGDEATTARARRGKDVKVFSGQ